MRDSKHKAALAHRRLIYQLCASERTHATALAVILESCASTRRCRSAACPICGLEFQQAAVALVDACIREPARAIRNRMSALTIAPASGCIAPDDLSVEACKQVATKITAALATLELPPAVIGFEVSFNEDTTGEFEPHWGLHGHVLQLDWLSDAHEKALRAAFPPSRLVKRPVMCEPLDQDPRGRLYPFKPERVRRVTELKTDDPERGPYRDTRRRALRPWQAVNLANVEHQRGFEGRLLTHRIDERQVRRHLGGFGWARDGP